MPLQLRRMGCPSWTSSSTRMRRSAHQPRRSRRRNLLTATTTPLKVFANAGRNKPTTFMPASLTFWAACRSANGSCTRPCSTSASTATPISSVRCLALHTSTRLHSPTAGICTFAAAAAGTPAGTPRSFLLLLLLLLLLLHLLLLHLHVDVAGVNVDLPAALGGGHFQLGANNVVHPHLAGAPAPAPTG